jgi:hypothetical protein
MFVVFVRHDQIRERLDGDPEGLKARKLDAKFEISDEIGLLVFHGCPHIRPSPQLLF